MRMVTSTLSPTNVVSFIANATSVIGLPGTKYISQTNYVPVIFRLRVYTILSQPSSSENMISQSKVYITVSDLNSDFREYIGARLVNFKI